jgi:hypothetical protein
MTIRRADDTILLEDICAVEDAETLMQELQAGATVIDWTECVHLHTACLQVILVSGVPIRGMPQNAALGRWVPGMLPAAMFLGDRETACATEV